MSGRSFLTHRALTSSQIYGGILFLSQKGSSIATYKLSSLVKSFNLWLHWTGWLFFIHQFGSTFWNFPLIYPHLLLIFSLLKGYLWRSVRDLALLVIVFNTSNHFRSLIGIGLRRGHIRVKGLIQGRLSFFNYYGGEVVVILWLLLYLKRSNYLSFFQNPHIQSIPVHFHCYLFSLSLVSIFHLKHIVFVIAFWKSFRNTDFSFFIKTFIKLRIF